MPNYNSNSGHGWMSIRLSSDGKEIKKLAAAVVRKPEEIMVKYYFQQVQRIAFEARRIMLKIIEEAETPTGRARALKGGKPGRIDSGNMASKVWARVYKTNRGGVAATVGWLDGRPGYTIFQEHGTRRGIVAMNALQAAGDYIEQEMDKLARGGSKYRRNTNWDWSAPTYGGEVPGPPDWYSR